MQIRKCPFFFFSKQSISRIVCLAANILKKKKSLNKGIKINFMLNLTKKMWTFLSFGYRTIIQINVHNLIALF